MHDQNNEGASWGEDEDRKGKVALHSFYNVDLQRDLEEFPVVFCMHTFSVL